jgi:hypothetical protein
MSVPIAITWEIPASDLRQFDEETREFRLMFGELSHVDKSETLSEFAHQLWGPPPHTTGLNQALNELFMRRDQFESTINDPFQHIGDVEDPVCGRGLHSKIFRRRCLRLPLRLRLFSASSVAPRVCVFFSQGFLLL